MTPAPWRLAGLTGHGDYLVPPGRPLLVGRGTSADLLIADPAVSRAHAEVQATPSGLRVRDLGSANGTLLNGVAITEAAVEPGDTVTFGRPSFRLGANADAPTAVPDPEPLRVVPAPPGEIGSPETLARLLVLARELAGASEPDRLAALVADLTFELVSADRVAVLRCTGPDATPVPIQARSRVGPATALRVPDALARRALEAREPVVTEDALGDDALRSGSVVASRVRSAIAAPMIGHGGEPVGVLYADRISSATPFQDGEARTVLAFAALAGASLARLEMAAAMRRQEEQRRNLERFVAPEVAAQAAAAGAALVAGGERCTVTVLFSDIRGFTGLAEQMAPEVVAAVLTEYFTAMTEVVFAHGGMLDKFLGDGLLAVWGAPVAGEARAEQAWQAALAMLAALEPLNRQWATRGLPPLAAGLALAHGEVFAGRIGSDHRLEYTVIGDTVNVAARLCAAAGPGEILVTAAVREALGATAPLTRRAGLEVRGRSGPVEAWGHAP